MVRIEDMIDAEPDRLGCNASLIGTYVQRGKLYDRSSLYRRIGSSPSCLPLLPSAHLSRVQVVKLGQNSDIRDGDIVDIAIMCSKAR